MKSENNKNKNNINRLVYISKKMGRELVIKLNRINVSGQNVHLPREVRALLIVNSSER